MKAVPQMSERGLRCRQRGRQWRFNCHFGTPEPAPIGCRYEEWRVALSILKVDVDFRVGEQPPHDLVAVLNCLIASRVIPDPLSLLHDRVQRSRLKLVLVINVDVWQLNQCHHFV